MKKQQEIAAEERRQEEEAMKEALASMSGDFADDLVKRSLSQPGSRSNSRPGSTRAANKPADDKLQELAVPGSSSNEPSPRSPRSPRSRRGRRRRKGSDDNEQV